MSNRYTHIQKRDHPFAESAALYSMDRPTEELIEKLTHNLGERVKELSCLYGISKLVEKSGACLDEILQGTVELIPPSWQYTEITCAQIILRDREYQTVNFSKTPWKQMSSINVNGERVGTLEVCYLKEKPESDEGPFLKEERSLLNVIAKRLGKVVEETEAKVALIESEERYRILTEKVTDGVSLIQDGRFVFVNNAFASMFGYPDSKGLTGKEAIDLVCEDFKKEFKKLHQEVETGASQEKVFNGKCLSRHGREFWVEAYFNIISWQGKPAYLHTARDITKRKHREIAVQQEADQLRRENIQLKSNIKDRYRFGDIIGKSPAMQKVYSHIINAAASGANVVIYGESGTGKELATRTIFDMTGAYRRSFVPVNCGAIPESVFESEFFGYRKGAFTGANANKHGFFDLAHKGTLFLDEVGELTLNMQVKLLRALECGEFTPVGDNMARKVDTRIIAATNRNILDMLRKGEMREDFYYRIHIIPINIPPLRERKEDIPLLIEHFLNSKSNDKSISNLSGRVMGALINYDWPGNIREMHNVLQRYLITGDLDFQGRDTWESTNNNDNLSMDEKITPEGSDYFTKIISLEKSLIVRALKKNKWNKSKVATELDIPRRTLYRKMKKIGLL